MKLTKKVELKSLHKKKEPWKEQVQNLIIKVQSMIHEKKKNNKTTGLENISKSCIQQRTSSKNI